MSAALTLFEFLEQTGATVHAFDIGRRVGMLARDAFLAFEQAAQPYPRPLKRKAWFALVHHDKTSPEDAVIWFLRLSLDEQGLLVQAERDQLLNRLLESTQVGGRGADPQGLLADNPCAFRPRDDRMALLHALLGLELSLPPSRFYAHALDYFQGNPGWDQWGFVGYQGIADVACRHPNEPLTSAIAQLPPEPLIALCHCLESCHLAPPLRGELIGRLHAALAEAVPDVPVLAALVRGLSGGAAEPVVRAALQAVLEYPAGRHVEVLAAIGGRAWEALDEPGLLDAYLVRLAANDQGQAVFERCLRDLLGVPAVAEALRQALRSPRQAASVRRAFARMTEEATGPAR